MCKGHAEYWRPVVTVATTPSMAGAILESNGTSPYVNVDATKLDYLSVCAAIGSRHVLGT